MADGVAWFGDFGGVVRALDLASGRAMWAYDTESKVKARPVRIGDTLIVGDEKGYVHFLDADTGALRNRNPQSGGGLGKFRADFVERDGFAWMLSTNGRLYRADPEALSVNGGRAAVIGDIINVALIDPMTNLLVILNNVLWGSFGLAVIAFTILVRLLTFPLTLRQLKQTRAMQALQPVVQELQKKYTDPKRRQEEMMKAYREAGVNPLGCLGPLVLQMPFLIGIFYAVRRTLAISPEALDDLSTHLYSWSYIQDAIPLEESFLGLNLAGTSFLMVALVGVSTWAQTKTTSDRGHGRARGARSSR